MELFWANAQIMEGETAGPAGSECISASQYAEASDRELMAQIA